MWVKSCPHEVANGNTSLLVKLQYYRQTRAAIGHCMTVVVSAVLPQCESMIKKKDLSLI